MINCSITEGARLYSSRAVWAVFRGPTAARPLGRNARQQPCSRVWIRGQWQILIKQNPAAWTLALITCCSCTGAWVRVHIWGEPEAARVAGRTRRFAQCGL